MKSKFNFNLEWIEKIKNSKVGSLDKSRDFLDEIKEKIDLELNELRFTVTDKTIMPFSGNKNDYHSIAIYAWPNPDTKDGLPWIRIDGKANPSVKTNATDSIRIENFCNTIMKLTTIYLIYKEEKYLNKIKELLEIWFINPETKMNPHMEYAQAIPGECIGRGIGLIDARHYIKLIDYISILENKKALDSKLIKDIKKWFKEFITWMENSQNGQDEEKAHNNHGSWYEAEITSFSNFVGDIEKTLSRKDRLIEKVKAQINLDGNQPDEMARKKAWHYFIFNIEAIYIAYRNIASIDLDAVTEVAILLKITIRFMSLYLNEPEKWPKKDDSDFWNKDLRERKALPIFWEIGNEEIFVNEIVKKIAHRNEMSIIELLFNTQNDYTVLFPLKNNYKF